MTETVLITGAAGNLGSRLARRLIGSVRRLRLMIHRTPLPADLARASGVEVIHGDEREIIQNFWRLAAEMNLFVGHNVLDFDLKFIYQRSIIYQIKPSRDISFARYRSAPVYDIMHEWTKWGRSPISLDLLSRALGIASPKECLDGSKVYPYYRAGRLPEICDYCKCDVETVRKVYRRLTFASVQSPET